MNGLCILGRGERWVFALLSTRPLMVHVLTVTITIRRMTKDDLEVSAGDLEALLAWLKAESKTSLSFAELNHFLKNRLASSGAPHRTSPTATSTPLSAGSNDSISSGFPSSASSFSANINTSPFYFGTPSGVQCDPSEPTSYEADANKIERPIKTSKFLFPDDSLDEHVINQRMSRMGINEEDPVKEMMRQMNDVNISEADVNGDQINEPFLKKFNEMNFNVGVGDSSKKKKFGMRQRVGRTPAKYKATSPNQPTNAKSHRDESEQENGASAEAPSPASSMDISHSDRPSQPLPFASEFAETTVKFSINLEPKAVPAKKGFKKKHRLRENHAFSGGAQRSHQSAAGKVQEAVNVPQNFSNMENIDTQTQDNAPRYVKDSSRELEVERLRKEGKEHYNNEEYTSALESFTKALQLAHESWPIRSTLLANRAAVLMMLDRYPEVIADCDLVTELDPKNIKICCRKGRALLKVGRLKDAELAFARVLEACPSEFSNSGADGAKADAKAGMRSVINASGLMSKLKMLDACLEVSTIEAVNDELLSLCPAHYPSLVLKAKCMVEAKRYDDARSYIEETMCSTHHSILGDRAHAGAAKSLPDRSSLQWRADAAGRISANFIMIINFFLYIGSEMGQIYLRALKNIKFCRSSTSSVISVVELIVADLSSLTIVDDRWNWVQDSLRNIQQFVSLKQTADALFKDDLFADAIQFYSEALKVDSEAVFWNAVLYCNRAACYMALSKFREALVDCHNSLSRQPDYSKAYLRRARVYKVSFGEFLN